MAFIVTRFHLFGFKEKKGLDGVPSTIKDFQSSEMFSSDISGFFGVKLSSKFSYVRVRMM